MVKRYFTIIASDHGPWRVGFVKDHTTRLRSIPDTTADTDPSIIATNVRRAMDEEGYRGNASVLAIPSAWCLCANVSLDGLPRRNRRSAMAYRLEEKLPIAAEELVTDFALSASGRTALGVSCISAKLVRLVDAMEQVGIAVQHICPLALLAAQQLAGKAPGQVVLILGHGTDADLVSFRRGHPPSWFFVPRYGPVELAEHVKALIPTADDAALMRAVNVEPETIAEIMRRVGPVEAIESDLEGIASASVTMSAAVLSGRLAPPIDLRRDDLAIKDPLRQIRRPLLAAIASVIFGLLCVSAAMWYRGTQYQRLAVRLEEEQRDIFRQALPGQAVPEAARMRLVSEERRLRGVSGDENGADAAPLTESASALLLLRETFERLPKDVRLRILEARFGEGRVYLDGQARSHGDAESVASMLRKNPTMIVEPPRSDQMNDQGVAFSISAAIENRTASGQKGTAP